MNYFLKKTKPSKKGEYLQIYISEYIPGKGSRNRSHIALGYVSDMIASGIANPVAYAEKMVTELNASKEKEAPQIGETSTSKNVGHFLLKAMIDSLSIDQDLAMMTSNKKFRYEFSSFLRAMIYAQVVAPGSKLTASERVIPNLYGCESFSYDQILDGVTYIGSDYQKFIELFNKHIQDIYPRRTDNVFFDCTNYYFEIDAEDDLRRKGPSKEQRKSPIVGQALLLDADQIPLGMTLFPGNESEKPQLRRHIEDIKDRYGVEGRVVRVADKGLNCARNIYAAVREANDGYIFSKSVHGKNLSAVEKEWVLLDNDYNVWVEKHDISGKLVYKYKESSGKDSYTYSFKDDEGAEQTFTVKEKRVVSYNPSLAAKQKREIMKEVDKATRNITMKGLTREEYGDCAKYVEFEAKGSDGKKVKINPRIKQDKIDEDLRYAGYNLLVTSEVDKSGDEIYRIYHGLWRIEESFRIMKSYLLARPAFMRTADGIHGHFTVCYLALTVLRLLEMKVFNDELTPGEIIGFIRDYNVTESTNGTYINNATAGSVYRKIKEVLGLSKLGNLYLTKKNIDNFFKNVEFNTSN